MAIRYALRTLTRDSGFAAVAVFTLALGIGANTAIFSLINSVLLQAVPYSDADRLVTIEEVIPKLLSQFGPFPVNGRHFMEWRKQSKSFDQLAAIDARRLTLTGSGEPEQIAAAYVSANCFSMLGVQPAIGRNFLEEEDIQGHNHVAIVTDALWRRRFSANRGIIGQTILLDGTPHVVVGVLPPTFHFFANHDLSTLATLEPKADVFRPIAIKAEDIGLMGDFNFAAIGKLKSGVTREQAVAELNLIESRLVAQLDAADRTELKASLTPLKEQMTGQSRRGLLVLLAAVGAVLLIVCVNLANLMLARAVARRRDAAIRTALGASRRDLIGHVLTESLLLSFTGGLLGLLAADWGVSLLVKAAPVDLPRLAEVHVDLTVLGFGLLLTVLTGVLAGILPAWRLSSAEPADALRTGGRSGTEGGQGLRVRNLLVASEVALSAMLLIAAGLLLHSFVRLMQLDKGFDTASVLAADITLPAARYKEEAMRAKTFDTLLPKIRAIPGVKAAGLVSVLPLEGEGWADAIAVEGERGGAVMERPIGNYRFVSPGYFAAMGIPILQGRVIEDRDRNSQPAVISGTVAKRLFHGDNPIGKRFRRGDDKEAPFEVVGVVGDIPIASLQKSAGLLVYVPYWYRSRMKFSLVARTTMDPVLAAPALRAAVREVDSDVPLGEMRTMDQVVSHSIAPRRFQLGLVLLFAASALALASLGIYGVVSYMVAQRRSEIGIRMALGAEGSDVHRLILSQGLRPVVAGLALGILGALMLTRVLNSLLFQVSGYDPATFITVAAVLLGIATLACFIPSRRAVGADPSEVLRYE